MAREAKDPNAEARKKFEIDYKHVGSQMRSKIQGAAPQKDYLDELYEQLQARRAAAGSDENKSE
jgi:hypothetical protein